MNDRITQDDFDKFYERVDKIFHFEDCLVEALHETIERRLLIDEKMVVFEDSVITLDMHGNPFLNEKGEIIKTKFPEKQLAIINAYWENKKD